MANKTKKFKLGPIQKAWVRALRSGKYKKVKRVLARVTATGVVQGYCCLGVLCDLAVKQGIILEGIPNIFPNRMSYGGTTGVLPEKVRKWAKVRNSTGDFANHESGLAEMNDDGKSFAKIADMMEENAAEIFTRSV